MYLDDLITVFSLLSEYEGAMEVKVNGNLREQKLSIVGGPPFERLEKEDMEVLSKLGWKVYGNSTYVKEWVLA